MCSTVQETDKSVIFSKTQGHVRCVSMRVTDTWLNISETKKHDFDQVGSKQAIKTHHKVSSANKNRSLNQGRGGVIKKTTQYLFVISTTEHQMTFFKA